jgi:hypothetical protein
MRHPAQLESLLNRVTELNRDSFSLLDRTEQLLLRHSLLLKQRVRILGEIADTLALEDAGGRGADPLTRVLTRSLDWHCPALRE